MNRLLILIFVLSVACMEQQSVDYKKGQIPDINRIETELPPNYKILCNSQGKYIGVMKHGIKLYHYPNSDVNYKRYVPFDTYQEAVNRCWEQYNFRRPKSDTVEYYNCDINIEERIEVQ